MRKLCQIPVWVEAALLLLDLMSNTVQKPKNDPTQQADVNPAAPAPAAAAGDTPMEAAAPSAQQAAAAAGDGGEGAAAGAGEGAGVVVGAQAAAGEPSQAPAAATAGPSSAAGPAAAAADKPAPPPLSQHEKLHAALAEAHKNWRPCGMLEEGDQKRGLAVAVRILRALHAHADKWAPSVAAMLDNNEVRATSCVCIPCVCVGAGGLLFFCVVF